MSDLAGELARGHLTWWPEIGLGYFPVATKSEPYDLAYFERVAKNAETDIGRALMAARCAFVNKYHRGALIDVGIGSGAFVELRNRQGFSTVGFDVNPVAVEWLERRKLFANPYQHKHQAAALWDVLEHIADFRPLLANVTDWLFISLPIFEGPMHVLRSKHYRKDEHYFYFTKRGLENMMRESGFALIEYSDMEIRLGREDIGSFAFRRH